VLCWFARSGPLDADDARDMLTWHNGGVSLDASVRIAGHDRAGLERRLRYCARPLFAPVRLDQVNGVCTQTTNLRRGLIGHLFPGRFKAILLVERDTYLLELARYIRGARSRARGHVPRGRRVAMEQLSGDGRTGVRPPVAADRLGARPVRPGAFPAQAGYVAFFFRQGIGQPSVWEGLRYEVFLGNGALENGDRP
jgi:hypothetical protein